MKAVPLLTDPAPPPLHTAIIMDGNGRWAEARGLPRTLGHKRGAEAVKVAVESAVELGVEYLTLYGFSSENWQRPQEEINDLMGLLRFYLQSEIKFLRQNGVR
ncbi:MAG: undecaprenyl diphosphate synthase family protein, partial [Nitrospinota bacterium]|nr:undecaprenyl diphosphate synthase family protein [Nitrospinota bacterium]